MAKGIPSPNFDKTTRPQVDPTLHLKGRVRAIEPITKASMGPKEANYRGQPKAKSHGLGAYWVR